MSASSPRVLYGGTFDPIHNGHVGVALAIADALQCPVSLLPAADPPHRARPGATAQQRAEMVALAIAGLPQLRLDTRELRRSGASYTIDTLLEVRAEVPADVPVVWLLGADALAGLRSWKHWRELFAQAHLLAFERSGHPLDLADLSQASPELGAELGRRQCALSALSSMPGGGFAVFRPERPLPESATEVRRRLASGGDWAALLAGPVAAYIRVHRLYGAQQV